MADYTLNTQGWFDDVTKVRLGSWSDAPQTLNFPGALVDINNNVATLGGDDSLTFGTLRISLLGSFIAANPRNGGRLTLDLGSGNDTLTVDSYIGQANASLRVLGGAGNDTVSIDVIDLQNGSNKFFADLGEGDDIFKTEKVFGNDGSVVDGGTGNDKLELTGSYSDYEFSARGNDLLINYIDEPGGASLTVKNFEEFVVDGVLYDSVSDLLNGPGSGGAGVLFVDTTIGNGRPGNGLGTIHPLPINQGTLNAADNSPAIVFIPDPVI